jgi:triacylglycerol lipase
MGKWVALWALVGACLALIGSWLALTYWRRRRLKVQARPRLRPDAPRYPLLLAHGVMGFESIGFWKVKQHYFRGIPDQLRKMGADVYTVQVARSGSIATRARQLAEAVRQVPAERVNIIAHSMGGLDARYAISRLGLSAKVVSLITVGTPHHRTPLADISTDLLGDRLKLKQVLGAMGFGLDAFYDLTTSKMAAFNREVPDAKGVAYGSFLAGVKRRGRRLNALLIPPHWYLARQVGDNDGIVPTESQRWGEVLGRIDADHWAQIGWSRRFDAPGFYASVAHALRVRGF